MPAVCAITAEAATAGTQAGDTGHQSGPPRGPGLSSGPRTIGSEDYRYSHTLRADIPIRAIMSSLLPYTEDRHPYTSHDTPAVCCYHRPRAHLLSQLVGQLCDAYLPPICSEEKVDRCSGIEFAW